MKKAGYFSRLISNLVYNKRYRTLALAVAALIFNLSFALYNGILGVMNSSVIFAVSAVYYLLLGAMRFFAVLREKKNRFKSEGQTVALIGVMLIILSFVFHVAVLVSMKHQTATAYGTVTMITIATFTFTKISIAAFNAFKHRKNSFGMMNAINNIRYSEVAVSLLSMQQSMLVSFGDANDTSATILNACTGAAICFFILALGIITLRTERKKHNGKKQNP